MIRGRIVAMAVAGFLAAAAGDWSPAARAA